MGSARLPGGALLRWLIRGRPETGPVTAPGTASVFAGFRFPPEVIPVAVGWYLRYGLSSRDAEELLAERGITVDHVTIYRWAQRFTPAFIEAAGPGRHAPGDRWSADQTYLKAAGCGVPELGHGP
jgi:transposase, IS6 family